MFGNERARFGGMYSGEYHSQPSHLAVSEESVANPSQRTSTNPKYTRKLCFTAILHLRMLFRASLVDFHGNLALKMTSAARHWAQISPLRDAQKGRR